jgi:hypothetical protein
MPPRLDANPQGPPCYADAQHLEDDEITKCTPNSNRPYMESDKVALFGGGKPQNAEEKPAPKHGSI